MKEKYLLIGIFIIVLLLSTIIVFGQANTSLFTNDSNPSTENVFNILTFPVKAFSFGNTHYSISKDSTALYSYSMNQESYQAFLLPSNLRNLKNYKLSFDFVVTNIGSQPWNGFRLMFDNQSEATMVSRNGFYISFFKDGTINFLNFVNGNWTTLESANNFQFNLNETYHVDLYISGSESLKLSINGSPIVSWEIPPSFWSNGNVGMYTSYANLEISNFTIESIVEKGSENMENNVTAPFSDHYEFKESKECLSIVGPQYAISFFKSGGIHYIYDQKERNFDLFNSKSHSNFELTFFGNKTPITLSNAVYTKGTIESTNMEVKQLFKTDVGTIESIYNFNTQNNIISNNILIYPSNDSSGTKFSNSSFILKGIMPNQKKSLWSSNVFGMIYSESKNTGFNVAYLSDSDFHSILVNNDVIEIPVQTAGIFLLNHTINIGTMYFWVSHGDSLECKTTFWNLFDYLGYKNINPSDIDNLKILEVDPGGPITTWFTGIGSFDKLWEYLQPAIKIGFNALWIMPSYPWSGSPYNIENYYKISSEYGGDTSYKSFIKEAEKKGIYIIQDIVPLGGNISVTDEDVKQWSRYGENGFIQVTFGHTFNYAAKGWQDYMAKVVEFYTKDFDVNGWRVDTAWENGPESFNWKEKYQDDHRASFASLGGDIGMLKAIFDASRKITGVNPLIMPENYMMTIPEFYKYSNLDYGGGLISNLGTGGEKQGFQSLMASNASPETWAYCIQKYLDEEYYSLPKWAYVMREVANHDTTSHAFSISVGLAANYYGINRLKAIMALLTFVRGVPMMYMTDWSDMQNYIAEIFKIRSENSALKDGNAVYDPNYIRASNGVIAFLRENKAQSLLVLVSMNSQNTESTVYINPTLYSHNKLKSIENGEIYQIKNGKFSISMPGFGYEILEF